MDFNSKEFKDLQKKWYKKAEDSGFDDIEQEDGNLKRWDSYVFQRKYNKEQAEAKESYYRSAGKFLYDYKFEKKSQREIWRLHAEGLSFEKILKVLKKRFRKLTLWDVRHTIEQLDKKMKEEWKVKKL